jgi:hypothetical protein
MKISYPRKALGIGLFLFLVVYIFFMPSLSGGSLKTEATIGASPFDPGKMLLLGSVMIGLAAWGRKKIGK